MTQQRPSGTEDGPIEWRLTLAQTTFAVAYEAQPGRSAPGTDGAVFLYRAAAGFTDRWLVAADGFVLQYDRL